MKKQLFTALLSTTALSLLSGCGCSHDKKKTEEVVVIETNSEAPMLEDTATAPVEEEAK